MNPLIKKQLENCKVANIPEFDDNTTHITIPKGSVVNVSQYQVGRCSGLRGSLIDVRANSVGTCHGMSPNALPNAPRH